MIAPGVVTCSDKMSLPNMFSLDFSWYHLIPPAIFSLVLMSSPVLTKCCLFCSHLISADSTCYCLPRPPHLPVAAGQLFAQHSAGEQHCWDSIHFTFCQMTKCLVFPPLFSPSIFSPIFIQIHRAVVISSYSCKFTCLTHACQSIHCSTAGLLQKERKPGSLPGYRDSLKGKFL